MFQPHGTGRVRETQTPGKVPMSLSTSKQTLRLGNINKGLAMPCDLGLLLLERNNIPQSHSQYDPKAPDTLTKNMWFGAL